MEIQLGEHDCACSMLLARAGLGVCQYVASMVARSGDGRRGEPDDVVHVVTRPRRPRAGIDTIFDSGREKIETFLTFVLYRLCSAPDRYALTMPNEARRRGRPSRAAMK